MSDRLVWGDDVDRSKVTQCLLCRHRVQGVYPVACPAFPGRPIPAAILDNSHDHREPYPGDHGILFEPIDSEPYKPLRRVKG